MPTSKLAVYNIALGHLGERKLASLAENREPRRVLDDYWDATALYCLERGLWKFARRSALIDASTSITPQFGLTHAFEKPSDWIRTFVISDNERFDPPLLQYKDENGLWYADTDPLYVEYVSRDPAFGLDLSLWPETFSDYVALRLAAQACPRITNSSTRLDILKRDEKKAKAEALSKDAMDGAPAFPPTGSWVRSRAAAFSDNSRWDRQS